MVCCGLGETSCMSRPHACHSDLIKQFPQTICVRYALNAVVSPVDYNAGFDLACLFVFLHVTLCIRYMRFRTPGAMASVGQPQISLLLWHCGIDGG